MKLGKVWVRRVPCAEISKWSWEPPGPWRWMVTDSAAEPYVQQYFVHWEDAMFAASGDSAREMGIHRRKLRIDRLALRELHRELNAKKGLHLL